MICISTYEIYCDFMLILSDRWVFACCFDENGAFNQNLDGPRYVCAGVQALAAFGKSKVLGA
jgi:hypothetical protein